MKTLKEYYESQGIEVVESTIPIKTNYFFSEDEHIVSVEQHPLINGIIVSGKTKEEADAKATALLNVLLEYHSSELKKLGRLAIFQGNYSKSQIWFKIIGVGLIIYIRPKHYKPIGYKKSPKGFWIGNRVRINFINLWRKLT
jgi:hypothetical protein